MNIAYLPQTFVRYQPFSVAPNRSIFMTCPTEQIIRPFGVALTLDRFCSRLSKSDIFGAIHTGFQLHSLFHLTEEVTCHHR